MTTKTEHVPDNVRWSLPLDAPVREASATYLRRLMALVVLAMTFIGLGAIYLGYRAAVDLLPAWAQPLPALLTLGGLYCFSRWRLYRDIPTALDQVLGLVLLLAFWPVVVLTRVYARIQPRAYRKTKVVGRKGRLATAVEWVPSDDGEGGVLKPSLFTVASLLPAIALGRVRFRGRPLVQLRDFCSSGPLLMSSYGRAPGVYPAYTRHGNEGADAYAGRLHSQWGHMLDRSARPARNTYVVLVLATSTVRSRPSRQGDPGRVTKARVLIPFVVRDSDEPALRARIKKDMGASDVLVGRGNRLPALLRAAWNAWGQDDGQAEQPKKTRAPKPKAPEPAKHRQR